MPRRIAGFHRDGEGHWVAELECGHSQHVRHDPPWQNRPWVMTEQGSHRASPHRAALRAVRETRIVSAPCPILGFVVSFQVAQVPDEQRLALWEDFTRLIERRGLCCDRGTTGAMSSHAVRSEAGQATDADREAVLDWARAHGAIFSIDVGPLIDLASAD